MESERIQKSEEKRKVAVLTTALFRHAIQFRRRRRCETVGRELPLKTSSRLEETQINKKSPPRDLSRNTDVSDKRKKDRKPPGGLFNTLGGGRGKSPQPE